MFGFFVGLFACTVGAIVVGVGICNKLGLFHREYKPEDLGDRALQAYEKDNIKPEDYKGRYDEYIKKIESIELDPEKSKKYSPEEKLKAAGVVVGFALQEHYGHNVESFVKRELDDESKKDFYTEDRTKEYLDVCAETNTDMSKIGDYLDDNLDSMEETRAMGLKLLEAEKKLGFSETEAKENIEHEKDRRENL